MNTSEKLTELKNRKEEMSKISQTPINDLLDMGSFVEVGGFNKSANVSTKKFWQKYQG